MVSYTAPIQDFKFLLDDVFEFDKLMQDLPGYEEVSADLAVSVLEEAGKFCTQKLEPLRRSGDVEGCSIVNGAVRTPKGMAQAYDDFVKAGWCGLSGDHKYGGQGLPHTIQVLLDEMLSSVNISFGLFPGLTRGAVDAIDKHATDEIKKIYLPKMTTGEWTGAMALTEASAVTDLGLLSTRSTPKEDGTYRVKGTKIFISSGDHDFGGNVIHLVLARLPDAPAGVKGISLFLVPKFLVNSDGSLGDRNTFIVESLEHKMGIHAQPTCVMNYDDAVGWLIGEPGHGLSAMFTMMNAERLFVGVQGLGIAEAANQKAVDYARTRLQGRSVCGDKPLVPIIEHPDVRNMLLTGRCFIDAARALAVWTAMQMDRAHRIPDEQEAERSNGLVALLTPVIKSSFTDLGFDTAVLSQQVFGGHGYIREFGMEQYVRDARITQIYEGTNGVQALDLVNRKLLMENGMIVFRLIEIIKKDLMISSKASSSERISQATLSTMKLLERATIYLLDVKCAASRAASASEYLRLFALTALGWMWSIMAMKASESLTVQAPLKNAAAEFFACHILPQSVGLAAAISSPSPRAISLDSAMF